MSGYFKESPLVVLETMEDVRCTLETQTRNKPFGVDGFRIKSVWLISLIDEIVAVGAYPYNADVARLAEERLGRPLQSYAEYSREGTLLSLLVYNAQCYRRTDQLIAQGYEPMDEPLLTRALAENRKIECGGKVLKVREINGRLYAMEPRKRSKYVVALGQPARLLDQGGCISHAPIQTPI